MAFTLGQKVSRVVRFLTGVMDPEVATPLSAYGFTEADRVEGWKLLAGLSIGKIEVLPLPPRDMQVLQQLDAWENHWFPIAMATLARRFPAVHARMFLNLSQTEGPEVAITVGAFVKRYDELETDTEKFGAEGAKAKAMLAERGLTPAVVEQARALLASMVKVTLAPHLASQEAQDIQLARAEDAMWAWYLEWSQVARIAIKQRYLLKQLGFLNSRGTTVQDEEETAPATTPAATPAATPASTTGGNA